VSGEPIVILAEADSLVARAIEALARFPRGQEWVLIGGLAVFLRLGSITRVTADVDTIARSQAELLDALAGYDFIVLVSGGNVEVAVRGTSIEVDVMDLSDDPLPDDDERRAFALARRAALDSAVDERIIVRTADGREVASVEIPVASVYAMVALKTVSMVRRPHGAHPEKVGSDIHDLVRLVAAAGARSLAAALVEGDTVLAKWIATQLDRAFGGDLRYTLLRFRRNDRSPGAQALTDDDVAATAILAAGITDLLGPEA
jgi:hypothetical protein